MENLSNGLNEKENLFHKTVSEGFGYCHRKSHIEKKGGLWEKGE